MDFGEPRAWVLFVPSATKVGDLKRLETVNVDLKMNPGCARVTLNQVKNWELILGIAATR